MGKINLSKSEKIVLRMVALGQYSSEYPRHLFNAAIHSLENKGLVKGTYIEGGDVYPDRMTDKGVQYLAENPQLHNPINWNALSAAIAIISTIISLIALFVACSR